jgi:hypothetical protein
MTTTTQYTTEKVSMSPTSSTDLTLNYDIDRKDVGVNLMTKIVGKSSKNIKNNELENKLFQFQLQQDYYSSESKITDKVQIYNCICHETVLNFEVGMERIYVTDDAIYNIRLINDEVTHNYLISHKCGCCQRTSEPEDSIKVKTVLKTSIMVTSSDHDNKKIIRNFCAQCLYSCKRLKINWCKTVVHRVFDKTANFELILQDGVETDIHINEKDILKFTSELYGPSRQRMK